MTNLDDVLNDVLRDFEDYARKSGLSVTTASLRVFGASRRYDEYRDGKTSPTLKTLARAQEMLQELKTQREASNVAASSRSARAT